MSNFYKYRFILNGSEVYPIVSDELVIGWEKEDESFFFRKKLNSSIKLKNADYDTIEQSTISTRHTLNIEKFTNGAWEVYYPGYFYKNDCEFDQDSKILTVKPKSDDGWDDLKKVLNNEYNFIDLDPEATNVQYDLKPILQLITIVNDAAPITDRRSNKITNNVGFSYWEESLDRGYNESEALAAGFVKVWDLGVFRGIEVFARYLTNKDTFNGVATTDRIANDISQTAKYFTKTSAEVTATIGLGSSQPDKTRWGLAPNCYLGQPRYFADRELQVSGSIYIAVNPSIAWGYFVDPAITDNGCQSYWVNKTRAVFDYEAANSEEITLKDGYKLATVIQTLLAQETDIVHSEAVDFSEFLYSALDPIAGESIGIVLTPKSNIVNSYYTNAARKSNIRLKEVFDLLKTMFDCYWHIETVGGEKRLRIEHISWYEQGGSYSNQVIDLDLTTSQDKRNLQALDHGQSKYKYNKIKMPQRFEFNYDNDTTSYFGGYPIEVLSNEVEEGTIEKRDAQKFIPDIEVITGNNTNVNLDGWAVLDTEENAGVISVKSEDIVVPTLSIPVQNGSLSFINLHPKYHRYGKPTQNIRINQESTTSLSVVRTKEQEVKFSYTDIEIDPLHLITTSIGSGQVESMERNLINDKFEITLNHDTE